MNRPLPARAALGCSAALLLALAGATPTGGETARTATAILRDVDAISWPGFREGVARDEFAALVAAAVERHAALVAELRRDHPEHPRLPEVLLSHWTLLRNSRCAGADVLTEAEAALESGPEALRPAALYARAAALLDLAAAPRAELAAAVDAALAVDPPGGDADWKATLLFDLAWDHTADPGEQRRLIVRVLKDFRATRSARDAVDLYELLKLGSDAVLPGDAVAGQPALVVAFADLDLEQGSAGRRKLAELRRARAQAGASGARVIGVRLRPDTLAAEVYARQTRDCGIDFPVLPEAELSAAFAALRTHLPRSPCFLVVDGAGRLTAACGRAGPLW